MGVGFQAVLEHGLVPLNSADVIPAAGEGVDEKVVEGWVKSAVDGSAGVRECLRSVTEPAGPGKGRNGCAIDVRESGAGKDAAANGCGGGARAWMS